MLAACGASRELLAPTCYSGLPTNRMPALSSANSNEQSSLSTAVTSLSLQKGSLHQGTQGLKPSLLKPGSSMLAASCAVVDLPAPQPCVSPRLCSDASSHAALQHQSRSLNRCATLRKASLNPAMQTLSKSADAIPARRLSSSLAASPRRQSKIHKSLSKSTEGNLTSSPDAQAAAIRRSRVMPH